ncbi:M23 family metallopeptidase [Hydrogenoanaerobacterium sp.]|uniref:M23 family metallopeptidase n=1 Tax=Hydrogenoanaerobacterium sp. TaxID=2953763 RepID=UPI0028A07494|nr:M23 family metallopeptidase [Hydrogenoanaerobacterium sp.]
MRLKTYASVIVFLVVCITVSVLSLGVRTVVGFADEAKEEKQDFIKWAEFNVPASALDKAYKVALQAHEEGLGLDMPHILGYLAATYWGNWKSYKSADVDKLLERVRAGESLDEMAAKYKDYNYFCKTYDAVVGGMVGDYAIELPDENGNMRWVEKYGLKAYLPVAEGFGFGHSDDFGNSRSFGYRRRHLGNDLMGTVGTPIIAVESGTVEVMGWNRYGGWRIGIRSFNSERYYYYAHLRKDKPFQPGLKEGDVVQGGDVIGYLGMTGYSDKENVNGMKVPHLHFGLQLIFDESQKDGNGEIWVDVYQLVNFLARNRSTVMRDSETGYYNRKYSYIDYNAQSEGNTDTTKNASG